MPLGRSKEGKICAEVKKHEQVIMENARKNSLKKLFHYLSEIPGGESTAIIVGGEAYTINRAPSGRFTYAKGNGLELHSQKELEELIELYTSKFNV